MPKPPTPATQEAAVKAVKRIFDRFLGGVTRSLNISYLRAVPIGTRVRIRSEVVQRGKTMALIRGVMVHDDDDGVSSSRDHHGGGEDVDGDDGRGEGLASRVYATVDHHKVHVPSKALAEFEKAEATAVGMGARGLGGNGKTAEKL
ncbi:MAG: hypothetical protein M1825_004458 [Sarcosagium campestre]|nr:MAG: hypothetical protein M1825_004458 [Sarcosagium campestre]